MAEINQTKYIEMKKGNHKVNQEIEDSERKKEKEKGDGLIEEPEVIKEKEKQDVPSEKVKSTDNNNIKRNKYAYVKH